MRLNSHTSSHTPLLYAKTVPGKVPTPQCFIEERATGFEPATLSLGS